MVIMLRTILIVLFISGTTFGVYHEKTRFDRSLVPEEELQTLKDEFTEPTTFIDYAMRYVAYKDAKESTCYLEKMRDDRWKSIITGKLRPRVLYPSSLSLTNVEAWKLAGGRVVDFCGENSIKLLQEMRPIPADAQDPFLNEIPLDENDVIQKRIADVVLTPLLSRAKREIMLENREQMNQQFVRMPRQTYRHGGKFRGQTQSQYLNHGGEGVKEGKAEAEATDQSSRALVSGTDGMGQAQSMSSGGSGCEDCVGYPGSYGSGGIGAQPSSGAIGYPSALIPGRPGSYPSGVISPPSGGVGIPGYVPSGVVLPGGGTGTLQPSYSPGSSPGITTMYPNSGGSYPSGVQQPGFLIPGGGPGLQMTYPGGVPPSSVPGVSVSYPGGVPQPITAGGGSGLPTTYPRGVPPSGVPGVSVSYPSGVQQPIATGGGSGLPTSYPGSVPPSSIPGSHPSIQQPGVMIPGNMQGPHSTGVQQPGGTIPGQYPVSGPSGTLYYPSGVQQPSPIIPGSVSGLPGSYPTGVQQPNTLFPGHKQYPAAGTNVPGSYPTGVQQPGASIPGQQQYPSGGVNIPGSYPTGVQQPGASFPGQQQYPTGGTNIPGSYPTSIQHPNTMISSSIPGTPGSYPTTVQQPGFLIPGQQQYPVSGTNIPGFYPTTGIQQPGTMIPSNIPGTSGSYPPNVQQPGASIPEMIPGQQQYPVGGNIIPGTHPSSQQPGVSIPGVSGTYPGISSTPGLYPGMYPGITGVPGAVYPGGQTQLPGYPVYPSGTITNIAGAVDDSADSHASSSVKQSDSGTQASATSDGKFGTGTAQSQVSGVYSGSGSFSAQAGTSDGNRGAQTQISGGKEGAMSNAQGMGGQGKSQAQVQLQSDTGATTTGAQSIGWNHGTNSQVQASAKGGMADAQADGEGNTSSQAQIGFQPYTGTKENEKNRSKPFRGGGQASAQSGTYRGQSQSQIDGSFQYGITYTGAAQAGSGSGAGASRKPFNFTNSDPNLFKSFEKFDPVTISKVDETTTVASDLDISNAEEPNMRTGSSSRKTIILRPQMRQEESFESIRDDPLYDQEIEEYAEEEYADEDYDEPPPSRMNSDIVKTRSGDATPRQIQAINIGNDKKHNVRVIQDSSRPKVGDILQSGHALPGYTIPSGFRGRVTSLSGEHTHAHGNGKSQAQTVSLAPSSQGRIQVGKSVYPETRSLKSGHERESSSRGGASGNQHLSTRQMNSSNTGSMNASPVKSNYFTVTKSVAGKMGDSRQKYEHRYYTKSSTCGYFTFSCNIVHGSNGRTKICKPKMPTYPDGTPMKC